MKRAKTVNRILTSFTGSNMFGAIAVGQGMLKPEQLEDGLNIQSRWADGRPLGEVLVELGTLSAEQRDRVLDIQTMTERRRRDALLGRIGVLNKFYTEEQLRDALRRPGARIGERLRAAGLVTDQQLDAMLRTQKRLLAESERAPNAAVAQTLDLGDRDVVTIGRDPSCDMCLDDREVSRRHCRLARRGGRTIVEDLGSLYGVFVDGRPVTGPTELSDGQMLMIGRTVLTFHEPAGAPRLRRLVPRRRTVPVGLLVGAAAAVAAVVFFANLPSAGPPPRPSPPRTAAVTPEAPFDAPEPDIVAPRDFELETVTLEDPPAEPAEEPVEAPDRPVVRPEETPPPAATEEPAAPRPEPETAARPDYDRYARDVRTAVREKAAKAAHTLTEFGDEGRRIALDAATQRRDKAAARIRGWDLAKKLEPTRRLHLQLFELRLAAILNIADGRHYTKETGQSDVDRKVQDLRRFYQPNINRGLGSLPSKGRAALEEFDWCDALVAELGGARAADESLAAARMLEAGPVTVGTLELPWERGGLAAYNRRVRELNAERRREISGEEYELVETLNDYREMLGRHRLLIDPALCRAARGHSEEMAKLDTLDHYSPTPERRTPDLRARLAGFAGGGGVGENILNGSSTGRDAHDRWYHSAPHHRNMLRLGTTDIGVGTAGGYWTELFGTVYREELP